MANFKNPTIFSDINISSKCDILPLKLDIDVRCRLSVKVDIHNFISDTFKPCLKAWKCRKIGLNYFGLHEKSIVNSKP